MTFFENQIIQALYSNATSSNDATPSKTTLEQKMASTSPTSVAATSETIKRNPEILYENLNSDSIFILLENLQWKEVVSRLKSMTTESPHYDEINSWVTKNDKRGMKLLFRRQPIHEACVRKAPPEVIMLFLAVNSPCASTKDNNGRTPLHHAFIHEVEMDVIYLLFNTNRDAIEVPDFWGKTPREYAMLSKSPHKKQIMQMFNQSNEEIASIVKIIETNLTKKSSLVMQIKSDVSHIKTQPNATELFLEEELEQARVESDIAYVQRDAAFSMQDKLSKKVKELEKQLREKNEMLQEMEDISRRNKGLNTLINKNENKNKELEKKISEQVKTIASIKDESESKIRKLEAEMSQKEKKFTESISEYKRNHEKMKDTITCLTNKLRRMDSNLDDTISVLTNDLDCEADEKHNASVESKVKYLEELVELYKGHVDGAKKQYETCNQEKIELKSHFEQMQSDPQASLQMCKEKAALAEIERDEYAKEVEVYEKCLDSSKARISTLQELVSAHESRSQQLEDELDITKESYLYVMDQLMEKNEMIDILEDDLDQLSADCNMMRDGYRASSKDLYSLDKSCLRTSHIRSNTSNRRVSTRRTRSISPFMTRRV